MRLQVILFLYNKRAYKACRYLTASQFETGPTSDGGTTLDMPTATPYNLSPASAFDQDKDKESRQQAVATPRKKKKPNIIIPL